MAKPQYGYDHQKAREDALKRFQDGDLCWRCRKPMYHWQALDLDHVTPVALGGEGGTTRLTHRRCNQLAGAKLGGKLAHQPSRKRKTPTRKKLRRW